MPLGEAIPGTRLWVRRAECGNDVEVRPGMEAGMEGELVVEGPGVAGGYYRRAEETAACFFFPQPCPEEGGTRSRCYRTGDWVHVTAATGAQRLPSLLFLGRRDGVVKVGGGVRVGLHEAERRVAEALGFKEACQQRQQLALVLPQGGDGLVLALTAAAAARVLGGKADSSNPAGLWRRLRAMLPPEMVPSWLVTLPSEEGEAGASLPLTSSGKVDRQALLLLLGQAAANGATMAAVVEGEESVGVDDDLAAVAAWLDGRMGAVLGEEGKGEGTGGGGFWDRGGTSLKAMELLGAVEARFGVRLTVEDLGREVKGLARRVMQLLQRRQRRESVRDEGGASVRLSVQWRVDLGKCVDARPCLVRGGGGNGWLAVAGSHSRVVAAADAETGHEKWRMPVGGRVEGGAAVSQDGALCMVGCYDGGLYALRVETGEVAWVVRTGGEVKGTPLSLSLSPHAAHVAVFGSYDGHMYVVNERDGGLLARVPLGGGGGSPFASPVALPVVEEEEATARVVMVTNRGRIAAFCLRWTGEGELAVQEEWAKEAGCAVFTTPAVLLSPSPALVIGGTDGVLRCLDLRRGGQERWRVDLGGGPVFCPPLAVDEGRDVVVGGQDGRVWRVGGADGRMVWVAVRDANLREGPAAITRRPALLPGGEAVVVADAEGGLRVLGLERGGTETSLVVGGGQRLGAPAVLEGDGGGVLVVVGSRDDGVYGVKVEMGDGGVAVVMGKRGRGEEE